MTTLIDKRIAELQHIQDAKLQINHQVKYIASAKTFLQSINVTPSYPTAQYNTDDELSNADTDSED